MRKSQIIALVILFVAVSVFIWIGAYQDMPEDEDPVNILPDGTSTPIVTATPEQPTASATPQITPTAVIQPTATPTQVPVTPTPTPTPAPTPVVFPELDLYELSLLKNSGTYWSAGTQQVNESTWEPMYSSYLKDYVDGIDFLWMKPATDQRTIYLTINLGWENGVTESMLDTLKKHNIKATFFISANYMLNEEYEDIIKRIYNEGHLIGSRGNILAGEDVVNGKNVTEFANDLLAMEKRYRELFGETERMNYYRPEYFSPRTLAAANQLGYTVSFWLFSGYFSTSSGISNLQQLINLTYDGAILTLNATAEANAILDDYLNHIARDQHFSFKTLEQ